MAWYSLPTVSNVGSICTGLLRAAMDVTVCVVYLILSVTFVDVSAIDAENLVVKGCRNHPADIVFVLDESGSIWGPHFQEQLHFVNSVVRSFDVSSGKTRIGVETFASRVRVHFQLGEYPSPEALEKAVSSITQLRGGTQTALALERMTTDMFSEDYARPDVPHVAVVITDGESDDPVLTAIQAGQAHDRGITVLAIGVGVMNDEELYAIASSEELVFTVQSYDALKKLKDILAWEACKATTPKPVPTTLPQYTQSCRPADVIFSVPDDAGIKDTQITLDFIRSLITDLDIGPEAVRVGMTPRLCDDKDPIPLKDHGTRSGYKRALRDRSLTSSRISRQMEQLQVGLRGRVPQRGDLARNPARIAVLIVDNVSTDPELLKETAELAHSKGIRVVTVGIGDKVDKRELSEIASGPGDWYHVTDYPDLTEIYDNLLSVICRPW